MVNLVGTYEWYTCIEKQISIGCCKLKFWPSYVYPIGKYNQTGFLLLILCFWLTELPH